MRMRKYEAWLQTAKPGESIIYHEGYLAKDRFYDYETRDIASMFYRHAENLMVVLFQKRLRHGNVNPDPKFQYIAKKI